MTKLDDRYKELFHQTPYEALVHQVARDIFEARLSHHHWYLIPARYADSLTFGDIAAVAADAVAPYNPALIGGRVLGTALFNVYAGMLEADYRAFVADVRTALTDRIAAERNKKDFQVSDVFRSSASLPEPGVSMLAMLARQRGAPRPHDPDNGGE